MKIFVRNNLRLNRSNLHYAGYFKKHLKKLDLIDASATVLNKAKELERDFSEPEPRDHYPYL